MTTCDLTITNLDAVALPSDMRDEAHEALSSGRETTLEYRRVGSPGRQPLHYLYFPQSGRGGICGGGLTDWTDCGSLDDLANRWANYDTRWSN